MFRFFEKVRYKWRRRRALVRFVVMTLDGIWRSWRPAESQTTAPKPLSHAVTQDHEAEQSRDAA
jgi:hypothetical protein